MNRAKVINSTWEALAECDLLAKVLNERSVALLRYHLEIIKSELATSTGVRPRANVWVREEADRGERSAPLRVTPPVQVEAQPVSSIVNQPSAPVKSPGAQ